MKRARLAFSKLSTTKKVLWGLALVTVLGVAAAPSSSKTAQQPSTAPSSKTPSSNIQVQPATTVPKVVIKTETQTQPIPFTTTTTNDATLAKGQTKVIVSGVNGVQTQTFQVSYTGDQETGRALTGTAVTTPPVTQVVHVGTYVAPAAAPAATCTNGSYVNSAGNTVCSPEPSPSAPSGATAKCVDGTYSFSQSRSGTCSHHGGVAAWL